MKTTKASELLLQFAEPFDKACMIVREMEAKMETLKPKSKEELTNEAFDKWIDYASDVLQVSDASDGSLYTAQRAFVDAYVMGVRSKELQ